MTDLTELTLTQAAEGLHRGDFSSRELTQAYLRRIELFEHIIHAFITVTPELALERADQADQVLSAWRAHPDQPLSRLVGVPIAIKDVLCVAGVRCTAGSRILGNFLPPYTATAINKLLSAGMVMLGKTNTDEFAMGSSTENSAFGVTHNPWNLARVPGGSSGGSAAAVAAHLAPIALGTDTGGSVRQPASLCGVTGLKPTYGRVSRYGLIAFGSSLDVIGVLGRDVQDVATIFSEIAGHDPLDSTSQDVSLPAFNFDEWAELESLKGLRIGIPDEYFIAGMQADVERSVRQAIGQLEQMGAQVSMISLPHSEYALPVYYLIAPAEASANLARYDGIRFGARVEADEVRDIFHQTRGEYFGAEVKRRIMLGTYALSAGYYDAYYGQAQKVRTLIKRDFEAAFGTVDVIAAPVSPTTAFPIGEHTDDPLAMYLEDILTIPANLAGIPGLAFPVGFDPQGLPIGMQLMAPDFQEKRLLQVAYAYQQVTDWHQRRPIMKG